MISEVFNDILNDREKLTQGQYQSIGEGLGRSQHAVYCHWRQELEPLLKRYHAGTLHVDIKELLIKHLVENQLDYTQQVDWKELAKLPKFAGTTPTYLRITYQNLRTGTKRRYPELSREELNTGAILRYGP